ncbi:MAG: AgmX/PglI C-terminal domain-containing protein [Bacteroidota bacterium]
MISLANEVVLPVLNVNLKKNKSNETLAITDHSIIFGKCNEISLNELDEFPDNGPVPRIEKLAECMKSHFNKGNDKKAYERIPILLKINCDIPFNHIFTVMNTLGFVGIKRMLFAGKNRKGDIGSILVQLLKDNALHDKRLPTIIVNQEKITFGINKGWVAAYYYNHDNKFDVLDTLRSDIDSIKNAYAPDYKFDNIILAFQDSIPFQDVATLMEFCISAGLTNIFIAKLRDNSDSSDTNTKERESSARIGGRPRDNVQKTVLENIKSLKTIYDQRRVENPELEGKILVRFAINDRGQIIQSEVIEQNVQDSLFMRQIVGELRRWEFGQIKIKGDVTEVIYPFVFTP